MNRNSETAIIEKVCQLEILLQTSHAKTSGDNHRVPQKVVDVITHGGLSVTGSEPRSIVAGSSLGFAGSAWGGSLMVASTGMKVSPDRGGR